MYADDTQLVKDFVVDGAESAKREMASDLLRLTAWADSHGLQLNPANSSLLVVGSPALRQQLFSFVISHTAPWYSSNVSAMMRCKIAMLHRIIAETLQVHFYIRLSNIAGVYFCKVLGTLKICSPATFRQWFCNEMAKLRQWSCNSSAILRCEITKYCTASL